MKSLIAALIWVSSSTVFLFAQKPEDIDLLLNTDFSKEQSERVVRYGFTEKPSKFSRYNPIYHILSSSMWIYQKYVSPQLARGCAFNPSCSAYSKQLIENFGILKGVIFSADRLMRCNRIALTGLSPDVFNTPDGKIHEHPNRYLLKE